MDFDSTHTFDATRDEVAGALLDPEFQASLNGVEPLAERTVLTQEKTPDGRVVRRTHCVLDVEISGVARSFLGDAKPAWIEEARWDPSEYRWEWVVLPEVGKELLAASGTIDLESVGAQTDRRVIGSVKVSVPIYGGRVEGWIVDGIKRAYEQEARLLRVWLEREKGPA